MTQSKQTPMKKTLHCRLLTGEAINDVLNCQKDLVSIHDILNVDQPNALGTV